MASGTNLISRRPGPTFRDRQVYWAGNSAVASSRVDLLLAANGVGGTGQVVERGGYFGLFCRNGAA